MNETKQNILIGVAWPYVNGNLHIGHLAGYLLAADIEARYQRLKGNEVLMVSGSDCYGTPITVEADKRGKTPKGIADEYHAKDIELFQQTLGLTYDLYTRTDTQHHAKITQDFFIRMIEQGYIFIGTTEQYFSATQNRFLPDRYIQGTCPHCGFLEARSDQCDNCGKLLDQGEVINPISKLTKDPVELKETQHYFIDWPKLQPKLVEYVDNVSPKWKEWVRNETKGWLHEGLKPRAITRDLDWGVPIPIDRIPKELQISDYENKRIYVWFDAVIGYFSASLLWSSINNKDWKPFWYGDNTYHYYFMGKDNLVFHTLFWPGQLMSYDEKAHLPDNVSINMFLNYDGKQFSKSRGVSIDIDYIVKKYGNDIVRFYLAYVMPEKKDASFTWQDFQERINSSLIGTLGNFIHRVLTIGYGVERLKDPKISEDVQSKILSSFSTSKDALEKTEFRLYVDSILQLAAHGNQLVDHSKLWELKKSDLPKFQRIIEDLYAIIAALTFLIEPLLPSASESLKQILSIERNIESPWEKDDVVSRIIKEAQSINLNQKPIPLFQKITDEQIQEESII
ncbi:methionine--tRNA ligase [candidate division WWE3 bacterium]|nr:methionine--tRNA ligase [candidate division WWE3 bacterium]